MFVGFVFWFCIGRDLAFALTYSPTCGNSQSKTIRFDDRLSLERARHELKKKSWVKVKLQIIGARLHLTKWNYNQSLRDGTHHFTMMQMHANADIEFNIHAVKGNKHLEFLIFIQENVATCGATSEKNSSQIDLAVFFSANSAEAGISLVVPCNLRRFAQKKLIGCGTQRCCKLRFCLLIDACLELFKVIFYFVVNHHQTSILVTVAHEPTGMTGG